MRMSLIKAYNTWNNNIHGYNILSSLIKRATKDPTTIFSSVHHDKLVKYDVDLRCIRGIWSVDYSSLYKSINKRKKTRIEYMLIHRNIEIKWL